MKTISVCFPPSQKWSQCVSNNSANRKQIVYCSWLVTQNAPYPHKKDSCALNWTELQLIATTTVSKHLIITVMLMMRPNHRPTLSVHVISPKDSLPVGSHKNNLSFQTGCWWQEENKQKKRVDVTTGLRAAGHKSPRFRVRAIDLL